MSTSSVDVDLLDRGPFAGFVRAVMVLAWFSLVIAVAVPWYLGRLADGESYSDARHALVVAGEELAKAGSVTEGVRDGSSGRSAVTVKACGVGREQVVVFVARTEGSFRGRYVDGTYLRVSGDVDGELKYSDVDSLDC